jgi:DNA (cytosine-5)-methyltransferase 1
MLKNKLKVVELFAGVGGFRLGLEGWEGKSALSNYREPLDANFEIIWSNQFEPSTKKQHASIVYKERFGTSQHSDDNISSVTSIPKHDLLVGGFPCQDYSVASTLRNSKGIQGKKGVLWWEIEKLLRNLGEHSPRFLLLENVDRLLKSPKNARGRDFAIMLSSLGNLGYAVEWRIINAADYGFPQKRKRVFIMAFKNGTKVFKRFDHGLQENQTLTSLSVINTEFEAIYYDEVKHNFLKEQTPLSLSQNYRIFSGSKSPFFESGIYIKGKVLTSKLIPTYKGNFTVLRDIILPINQIPEQYFISSHKSLKDIIGKYPDLKQHEINSIPEVAPWITQKLKKSSFKLNKEGFYYKFSEGSMSFPDSLDLPSRTIVTGEGGKGASRFKHVVFQNEQVLRRLTPIELELLNQFPANHTKSDEVTDARRAFFMGNALVVGVVEKLGRALYSHV